MPTRSQSWCTLPQCMTFLVNIKMAEMAMAQSLIRYFTYLLRILVWNYAQFMNTINSSYIKHLITWACFGNLFLNPVYSDLLEHSKYWAFPAEDINGNFQEDRVKVVGNLGRGGWGWWWKPRISRGVNAKKLKIPGKSSLKWLEIQGGQFHKRMISSTGGYNFFSGKYQWISWPFSILILYSLQKKG